VFGDVELGHGRQAPWGAQAVVITQGAEAELTAAELTAQIPLHTGEVIASGSDMEGIDHHLGRLIRWQGCQQLAPQLPPARAWQQVILQLGAQQRPWFTPQAFDHVAEVDPPPWPALARAPMQPWQGLNELAAQEQIQPVVVQMHR
jgi:hypothetical protein